MPPKFSYFMGTHFFQYLPAFVQGHCWFKVNKKSFAVWRQQFYIWTNWEDLDQVLSWGELNILHRNPNISFPKCHISNIIHMKSVFFFFLHNWMPVTDLQQWWSKAVQGRRWRHFFYFELFQTESVTKMCCNKNKNLQKNSVGGRRLMVIKPTAWQSFNIH